MAGVHSMISKEDLILKYKEYKDQHQAIPKYRDFLKFAEVHSREVESVFGRDAYSKLQQECGDDPNKLTLVQTPRETIMRRYGDLALKLNDLPVSAEWKQSKLKPSIEGLGKPPHSIAWSEFPQKFSEWVKTEGINGYEKVIKLIESSSPKSKSTMQERDREFEKLLADIRSWSPGRRRNSEGEYKVELRGHLKAIGYEVNEEVGESNIDLLVKKKYMIEIKKDPKLGEYDRLFGQIARHLQHQFFVIALIFDVPGEDNFSNFGALVDSYLNKDKKTVEVLKK
jgi:hypothetical protein